MTAEENKKESHTLEYNTQRKQMVIPEYGRNILKMINYIKTIQDREKRTNMAHTVAKIMSRLHHNTKQKNSNDDLMHKIWDHIFIMSDYELDVDAPYPKPSPETFEKPPERIKYPHKNLKYNQYGKTIQLLIDKARTL
ncbi:MAG: DUF4290 domain-containing protein, partial [Flavobacteriales bacterium]